ncbi:MAG TPA: TorF family putative porin [Hyphomicrobiaceae bacterium]|jgi:uncharacterized protein (TIGR02001 family)
MSIRNASLGAASLLAAAAFAGPALADGMPSRGRIAEAPATRPCSTSGNIGYTTDYVFRGISQNNENGAVQGGVDLTCGNFYLGAWGSNVAVEGTHEVDIYGGYRTKLDRFAIDLGLIYYAYPGTSSGFDADYLELKAAASTEVWRGGTAGATVFYSPDYLGGTGPTWTLEGTLAQALPKVGMFSPTLSVTYGHLNQTDNDFDYNYWNVGLTVGFLEKWSFDLRYWDTDISKADCDFTSICDSRVVGTVKYTF